MTRPISEFVPAPYLTLPRTSVAETLTLGKALLDLAPETPTKETAAAVKRVALSMESIQLVMVSRLRDAGFSREDVKFDLFVDGLWALLRDRNAGWLRYQHEGSSYIADDPELGFDYDDLRERVQRAETLQRQLFNNGLDFTRVGFAKQAQLMANLLDLIETDGLEDTIAELASDELLPTLRACQRRYERMVKERLGEVDTSADLRRMRATLVSYIVLYNSAIIATLDEEEPGSVERVEATLQPVIKLREEGRGALLRGREGGEAGEVSAGEAEPEAEPKPEPEPEPAAMAGTL